MIKKFACILLSLIIALLCACPVFAQEETVDLQQEETAVFAEEEPQEYAAEIYVCARVKGIGHVWVYIKNISSEPVEVGCYEVNPGEGVTVGTFFFSRSDGAGIYYNVEAYVGREKGLDGTVVAGQPITARQLEAASAKIRSSNQWTPFTNCGMVARGIYKAATGKGITYAVFPIFSKISIKSRTTITDPETVIEEMKSICTGTPAKQRGSGDNAHYEQASQGSLKKKIG